MQLPAGLLIDRFGVARLLPAIAALAGLSAFMFARSDGFVTAILARSLLGAAAAFVTPALASVVRGVAPASRFALMMGIGDMAIGIGGVLGVAGGNALENAVGWRTTLVIAAIVAIPIAITLLVWIPRRWFSAPPTSIGEVHTSPLAAIKEVISQRTVRIAALVFAVSCGTVCGFGGMWNMKLAEGWAWNEQEATIITASFYVGARCVFTSRWVARYAIWQSSHAYGLHVGGASALLVLVAGARHLAALDRHHQCGGTWRCTLGKRTGV